jgi:hypothetical protein
LRSQRAKGNMYKGPFHLPRMLWFCEKQLASGSNQAVRKDPGGR